jgi:hypothetical protein
MAENVEPLAFGPLANSLHSEASPPGRLRRADNVSVERGVLEGSPRYGDIWARSGAHAGDVGHGLGYGRYQGREEALAVVQLNGEATARLYSINVTTGAWTAIDRNGSTALNAGPWEFRQFEGYLFALNATQGLFKRRIGGADGDADDAWRAAPIQYEVDVAPEASAALERPPYPLAVFATGTTADFNPIGNARGVSATEENRLVADGEVRLTTWGVSPGLPLGAVLAITLPSAVDWSGADWISFRLEGSAADLLTLDATRIGVRVLEATPAPDIDTAWYTYFASGLPLPEVFYASGDTVVRVTCEIQGADRDAVRVVLIGLPFVPSEELDIVLSDVRVGGRRMMDLTPAFTEVEYAVGYWNPTTSDLSQPARLGVTAASLNGQAVAPGEALMGAAVNLTAAQNTTLFSGGYTKIRFYRRENVPTEREPVRPWRQLGEIDHGAVNAWVDRRRETELYALTRAELDFGDFEEDFEPEAIGVWKQHLILASRGLLYMSWAGMPQRMLPSRERLVYVPDPDDLAAGRTLPADQGNRAAVRALAPQDLLFICTERAVLTMIGDQASDATPPRELPLERPPLGPRAAWPWRGGVLVAAQDGLWHFRASRGYEGMDDGSYSAEELTAEVRESWAALLTSPAASAKLVVVEHDDEIWCFAGTRFMRLTRPALMTGARQWQEGTWPAAAAAVAEAGLGLRLMLANGKVARVGRNASGVAYTTDAGAAVNWTATWPLVRGMRRQATRLRATGAGAAALSVRVVDGQQGTQTVALARTGTADWRWPAVIPPGSGIEVSASGVVGVDELASLVVISEDQENYES